MAVKVGVPIEKLDSLTAALLAPMVAEKVLSNGYRDNRTEVIQSSTP